MREKLPAVTSPRLIAEIFMNLCVMKRESILVNFRKSYHVSPVFHCYFPPPPPPQCLFKIWCVRFRNIFSYGGDSRAHFGLGWGEAHQVV